MAMTQRSTVVGVFEHRADAERAVDELHRAGFREDQVGIALRGDDRSTVAGGEHPRETRTGEGATTGAVIGGLLGAAAALLIPGFGPVIAGGTLAAVLGGAAVGAAAGGLLGALVGMGIPEEEARYYEGEFKSGRTIVTVKSDGRSQEAMDILRRHGAYGVEGPTMGTTTGTTHAFAGSGAATTARASVETQRHDVRDTETTGRAKVVGTMPMSGMTTCDNCAWDQYAPTYRQAWERQYGTSGGRWEDAEPGYHYGYEMASDQRYRGREWSDVESEFGTGFEDWSRRNNYRYEPGAWDRVKQFAREAWTSARTTAQRKF